MLRKCIGFMANNYTHTHPSGGAWFPLKTFDCSASFRFPRLTFSESWMPLQLDCTRLNHCHLRMSHEPLQPWSLRIIWQRNKSVNVMLMAALLDQNVKKPSERWHLTKWSHFFFIPAVTKLIQSGSTAILSFLIVCESYICRRKKRTAGWAKK